MLLGLVTEGLDKPNAKISASVKIAMGVLLVTGMVAMAVVILIRFDRGMKQLSIRTHGRPPAWRRITLVVSLMFMLLFDVLMNMAAAFAGAQPFLLVAIPVFVLYLLCVRLAYVGLSGNEEQIDSGL